MSVATDLNARIVAGLATVVKNAPGAYTVTDRRWNSTTGEETDAEVTQILIGTLNTQIDEINAQVIDLRDVQKADLVALKALLLAL